MKPFVLEDFQNMEPAVREEYIQMLEDNQAMLAEQQEHLLKMGGISRDMADSIREHLPEGMAMESFTGHVTKTNYAMSLEALNVAATQTSTSLALAYLAQASERLATSKDSALPVEIKDVNGNSAGIKACAAFKRATISAVGRLPREIKKAVFDQVRQDVPEAFQKGVSEGNVDRTVLDANLRWRASQDGVNVATYHMLAGSYESAFVIVRSHLALLEDIFQSYENDFFPAVTAAIKEKQEVRGDQLAKSVQEPNAAMAVRTEKDLVGWVKNTGLKMPGQTRLSWLVKMIKRQEDLPTIGSIKRALWHAVGDAGLRDVDYAELATVRIPGQQQYEGVYRTIPAFARFADPLRELTREWGEFSGVGPDIAAVIVEATRFLAELTEDLVSCKQLLDLELASYSKAVILHRDAAKFAMKQLRHSIPEGLEEVENLFETTQV